MSCRQKPVAKRLGLISPRATAETAHDPLLGMLPDAWDVGRIQIHHWLVKRLGTDICSRRRPHCWRCPVRDICPTHGRIRAVLPARGHQWELPLHAEGRPAAAEPASTRPPPIRLPGPSGRLGPAFTRMAGAGRGQPAGPDDRLPG